MGASKPEEGKEYSYGLSNELMTILESDFQAEPLVEKFAEAVGNPEGTDLNAVGYEVFGTFGRNLADHLAELEGQYRDRSAELIYAVAQKTGHFFPSPQQRLLEIALLAVFPENTWAYDEISYQRLAYAVKRCSIHQLLIEKIGKIVADHVPCSALCVELFTGLCRSTDILEQVEVSMLHRISEEFGQCVFEAKLKPEYR